MKVAPALPASKVVESPAQIDLLATLTVGFAIIVTGFMLMSGGNAPDPNTFYPNNDPTKTPEIFSFQRITLAPIIVMAGFMFEIYAIMKKPKSDQA